MSEVNNSSPIVVSPDLIRQVDEYSLALQVLAVTNETPEKVRRELMDQFEFVQTLSNIHSADYKNICSESYILNQRIEALGKKCDAAICDIKKKNSEIHRIAHGEVADCD